MLFTNKLFIDQFESNVLINSLTASVHKAEFTDMLTDCTWQAGFESRFVPDLPSPLSPL